MTSASQGPFGLSAAPSVFTKVMAVVAAFLDDWESKFIPTWMTGFSRADAECRWRCSVSLIHSTFSLLVNAKKSLLTLLQSKILIGAGLDSTQARVFLPDLRFQVTRSVVIDLKAHPVVTA